MALTQRSWNGQQQICRLPMLLPVTFQFWSPCVAYAINERMGLTAIG